VTCLLRTPLLLACCATLAAGAFHAAARLVDAVPLSILARESAEEQRLTRVMACSEARRRFKEGLADDLAQGRLALAEAIARVRDYLDAEGPAEGSEARWYGRRVLRTVRGATEEERCGRNLIRLVELDLRNSPGAGRELLARLERELQACLRAKGLEPGPAATR
jgi:hypothetical protein